MPAQVALYVYAHTKYRRRSLRLQPKGLDLALAPKDSAKCRPQAGSWFPGLWFRSFAHDKPLSYWVAEGLMPFVCMGSLSRNGLAPFEVVTEKQEYMAC